MLLHILWISEFNIFLYSIVTGKHLNKYESKSLFKHVNSKDFRKTSERILEKKKFLEKQEQKRLDYINDINADIGFSTQAADGFVGGSGYTDGTYVNVPLTGGTTGSGLAATITVAGGTVTTITDMSHATLQEYQIGDVLSAADSNLGGGCGS